MNRSVKSHFETSQRSSRLIEPVVERDIAEGSDRPRIKPTRAWISDDPLDWTVEDELATITTTTIHVGNDGKPKGVMYSHRGAYRTASVNCFTPSTAPSPCTCGRFPCSIAMGGARPGLLRRSVAARCLRAVQPERIWQLLEQEKVTHLNGAPRC